MTKSDSNDRLGSLADSAFATLAGAFGFAQAAWGPFDRAFEEANSEANLPQVLAVAHPDKALDPGIYGAPQQHAFNQFALELAKTLPGLSVLAICVREDGPIRLRRGVQFQDIRTDVLVRESKASGGAQWLLTQKRQMEANAQRTSQSAPESFFSNSFYFAKWAAREQIAIVFCDHAWRWHSAKCQPGVEIPVMHPDKALESAGLARAYGQKDFANDLAFDILPILQSRAEYRAKNGPTAKHAGPLAQFALLVERHRQRAYKSQPAHHGQDLAALGAADGSAADPSSGQDSFAQRHARFERLLPAHVAAKIAGPLVAQEEAHILRGALNEQRVGQQDNQQASDAEASHAVSATGLVATPASSRSKRL